MAKKTKNTTATISASTKAEAALREAPKVTASQVVAPPTNGTPTVETAVQRAIRLTAELKAAKDEAAKERETAEKEVAKRDEANKAKREEATADLAALVADYMGLDEKWSKEDILSVCNPSAIVQLETTTKGEGETLITTVSKKGQKLQAAIDHLKSLVPASVVVRHREASNGDGTPRTQKYTVTLAQKRVLTYLSSLPVTASADNTQLTCVARSLPFGTPTDKAKMSADTIGYIRDGADQSAKPYSLLSRQWVELVKGEGKQDGRLRLTDAGRKAATENVVELAHDYAVSE